MMAQSISRFPSHVYNKTFRKFDFPCNSKCLSFSNSNPMTPDIKTLVDRTINFKKFLGRPNKHLPYTIVSRIRTRPYGIIQ